MPPDDPPPKPRSWPLWAVDIITAALMFGAFLATLNECSSATSCAPVPPPWTYADTQLWT